MGALMQQEDNNNVGGGGGEEAELDALREVIPGEPRQDYPIYSTNILCKLNPRNCRG